MNDTFDPGPGWREVPYGTVAKDGGWLMQSVPDGEDRFWVPETPVPPLPTEPYTVIRVQWKNNGLKPSAYVLTADSSHWQPVWGPHAQTLPENIAKDITGFVVLSEPRAVTAKAVLDRVSEVTRQETEAVMGVDW